RLEAGRRAEARRHVDLSVDRSSGDWGLGLGAGPGGEFLRERVELFRDDAHLELVRGVTEEGVEIAIAQAAQRREVVRGADPRAEPPLERAVLGPLAHPDPAEADGRQHHEREQPLLAAERRARDGDPREDADRQQHGDDRRARARDVERRLVHPERQHGGGDGRRQTRPDRRPSEGTAHESARGHAFQITMTTSDMKYRLLTLALSVLAALGVAEIAARVLVARGVLVYRPLRVTQNPAFWSYRNPAFGVWHEPHATFHH